MNRHNRYLAVSRRLAKRYQDRDGRLIFQQAGAYTRYAVLMAMSAVKYLGCDPWKFPELRNPDGTWLYAPERINSRYLG